MGELIYSGTAFIGLDTRLVPMYLGLGQAEGGEQALYFYVGKPFGR